MILLGSLLAIGGTWIFVNDQEETTTIIQYIILINISYLADQGVAEYLHKILDKYRKKTSYVFLINMKGRAYNPGLDFRGLPLMKIRVLHRSSKSFLLPINLGVIIVQECKGNESSDQPNNDQPVVEGCGTIYRKGEEFGSPWKEEEGPIYKG